MSQETNGTHIQKSAEDDEIDLITLVKPLWEGRKTIVKTTLLFMLIWLLTKVVCRCSLITAMGFLEAVPIREIAKRGSLFARGSQG